MSNPANTINKQTIKEINEQIRNLAEQIKNSVSKEDELKAMGRYDPLSNKNENNFNEYYEVIKKNKYSVEILDNIECKNADNKEKYIISIKNESGVYYNINLQEYTNLIKDFDFDAYEYILNIINKIEGAYSDKDELIDSIVKYLSIIIYNNKFYVRTYSVLGFEEIKINNEPIWIFKYDKIYNSNLEIINGRLIKEDNSLGKKDDNNYKNEIKWISLVINTMNKHVLDAILLGAGVSGLVRQLLPYSKDSNININICGDPGSGKSTIGHLILSIYGNPQFLEGNFSDTENAIEQIRGNKPIMPYIIDDRMLKYISESEAKKAISLILDIFRESEGRIKERMGYMGDDSGKRNYSAVISSSVESVLDAIKKVKTNTRSKANTKIKDIGQYRRFIEFKLDQTDSKYRIADNKEEAEEIEKISQSCYGYGIYIFAKYLLEMLEDKERGKEYIEKEFNKLDTIISGKLDDNLKAASQRFTLIVLSYRFFRESLWDKIYEILASIKNDNETYKDDDKSETYEEDNNSEPYDEAIDNDLYEEDNNTEPVKLITEIYNQEDDIIDLLIDNLERKMNSVKEEEEKEKEEEEKEKEEEEKEKIDENITNDLKNWIQKPENLKYFLKCSDVFDASTMESGEQIKDKSKLMGNINISKEKIEIAYKSAYALESILFSPDLDKIDLDDFSPLFEQAREFSIGDRIEKYKELGGYAVDVYGSNVKNKKSKEKIIKTSIDAYVYNKDNHVDFRYCKDKGSYYNGNNIESDQSMTLITIKL